MIKIYVEVTGYGSRGPLYRVEHEGQELISGVTTPFFDGARALAAKGLTGPFEMWDHERPYARMKGTIESAAKLTVSEGERPPTVVKWTPRVYDANS